MAKKTTIKAGLFQKTSTPTLTTPTTTTPTLQAEAVFDTTDRRRRPEATKVKAISVSLTMLEYGEIDQIAAKLEISRMGIMNAAIRHTLAMYRAGKIKIKTGQKAGRVTVSFE